MKCGGAGASSVWRRRSRLRIAGKIAGATPSLDQSRGLKRRHNRADLRRSANSVEALLLIGTQKLLELRSALRIDRRSLRLQTGELDDRAADRQRIGIRAAERVGDGLLFRLRLLGDRLQGGLARVQNFAPGRNLIGGKIQHVRDHTDRILLLRKNRRGTKKNQ